MLGTCSIGIPAPIYRGDRNVLDFICDALSKSATLENGDVVGITESLVARSQNNYCNVDDIAKSVKSLFPTTSSIYLYEPIASRNRFSLILRGVARAFKGVNVVWRNNFDEVGNYIRGEHPFTGLNYREFYKGICEEEGATFSLFTEVPPYKNNYVLDCRCHPTENEFEHTLKEILKIPVIREDNTQSGFNPDYGVLGSNIAGPERLKLFPRNGQEFVLRLQEKLQNSFGVHVECLIYGDGCFKDPVGGIWEFADPVTCPGSTISWDLIPSELKLKLLADTKTDDEIISAIKSAPQQALGTTPRRVNDLLASLMDLTSGSGDKGTPIVVVKNYFTHFTK